MLKIYVVGSANSGKTTVSAMISKMLDDYGIETKVVPFLPGELAEDHNPFEHLDSKIEGIKRMNGTIEIQEMQSTRNGDFNVIK